MTEPIDVIRCFISVKKRRRRNNTIFSFKFQNPNVLINCLFGLFILRRFNLKKTVQKKKSLNNIFVEIVVIRFCNGWWRQRLPLISFETVEHQMLIEQFYFSYTKNNTLKVSKDTRKLLRAVKHFIKKKKENEQAK